jgi:protease I
MANNTLNGLKVAILVEDGFEQVELTEPRKALDAAGAQTKIVSPRDGKVRAWKFTDWGIELPVDVKLDQAKPGDFDALLLPGGVMNPDSLRMEPKAVAFAKAFFDAGKPVASLCHGPWTVIEAGAADGRRGRR